MPIAVSAVIGHKNPVPVYTEEERQSIRRVLSYAPDPFGLEMAEIEELACIYKGWTRGNKRDQTTPYKAKDEFVGFRKQLRKCISEGGQNTDRLTTLRLDLHAMIADRVMRDRLYGAGEELADAEDSLPDFEATLFEGVKIWPVEKQLENALDSAAGRAWLERALIRAENRVLLESQQQKDATASRAAPTRWRDPEQRRGSGPRPDEPRNWLVRHLAAIYRKANPNLNANPLPTAYYVSNKDERDRNIRKLDSERERSEKNAADARREAENQTTPNMKNRLIQEAEGHEKKAMAAKQRRSREAERPAGEANGEVLEFLRACLSPLVICAKTAPLENLRGLYRRAHSHLTRSRLHYDGLFPQVSPSGATSWVLMLETRSARLRLPIAKTPVFVKIAPGVGLGYRRNRTAGTWVARVADGKGTNWTEAIGHADDFDTADGNTILDYWQAQEKARAIGRVERGSGNTKASRRGS